MKQIGIMRRNLILSAAMTLMFAGCRDDSASGYMNALNEAQVNIVGGVVTGYCDSGIDVIGREAVGMGVAPIRRSSLQGSARSVADISQLTDGSQIEIYASGGFTAEGVKLTLEDGIWTYEEDLKWCVKEPASIMAYSPPLSEIYNEGQLMDLLVCKTTTEYGGDVELSFQHAFAKIVFSVTDELNEELTEINITPSVSVSDIDPWSGETGVVENETNIVSMGQDESGEYSIYVPAGERLYVSVTINTDDETTLTAKTEEYTFEAGKRYACAIDKETASPGIYTAKDFIAFSNLINGTEYEGRSLDEFGVTKDEVTTYKLMNDIVLSEEQSAEVCVVGQSSDTAFEYVFDGQGYYISGLTKEELDLSVSSNYGLFGYIGEEGVVKDLTLRNASMSATGSAKISKIALLCASNSGIIDGCRLDSCSLSSSQSENVGCMVGTNKGTMVNCCSVESSVVNSYTGSDMPIASGLVGTNQGEIVNCYVAYCKLTASYTASICCQTASTNSMTNVYAYKITRYNSKSHAGLVYNSSGTSYTWCFSGSSSQLGTKSDEDGTYQHTQANGEFPKYDGKELYVYFNEWIDENPNYSKKYEVLSWATNDMTEPFVFLFE